MRLLAILLLALGTSTSAHAQSGDVETDGAPLDGQSAGADDHRSTSHIFWVIPAFNVEYGKDTQPLTTREKFDEWARGAYDPIGLSVKATEAALERSGSGFCGYGEGWDAYGKCYVAGLADGNVSSFLGDYVFATLIHEDPRYFRRGEGAAPARIGYAVSRVFLGRMDSGRTVADSALLGTAIAAATSNLYYPPRERGIGLTMSRIYWDLGSTALFNMAAEFWPDVQRVIRRPFGRTNNAASDGSNGAQR